jgi:hypothetical protein
VTAWSGPTWRRNRDNCVIAADHINGNAVQEYGPIEILLGAEFTRAYVERHGSHASERETDGEGGSLLLAI